MLRSVLCPDGLLELVEFATDRQVTMVALSAAIPHCQLSLGHASYVTMKQIILPLRSNVHIFESEFCLKMVFYIQVNQPCLST